MAWTRECGARSVTPLLIPVIVPRKTRQLDDYRGSLEVALTDEQYTRVTEVSSVPLGVPHDSNEGNRARLLGGDPSLVIQGPAPVA